MINDDTLSKPHEGGYDTCESTHPHHKLYHLMSNARNDFPRSMSDETPYEEYYSVLKDIVGKFAFIKTSIADEITLVANEVAEDPS